MKTYIYGYTIIQGEKQDVDAFLAIPEVTGYLQRQDMVYYPYEARVITLGSEYVEKVKRLSDTLETHLAQFNQARDDLNKVLKKL